MSDRPGSAAVAKPIPKKLKHDAIVEAIFEIRFDSGTIPEILLGRLADSDPWRGLEQNRLPTSEIPPPMREMNAHLRFSPVIELRDQARNRAIKIGPHVLSYHQLAPYVGWAAFKPELIKTVEALFKVAQRLSVKRLGFRYANACRSDLHGIKSVRDLDLTICVDQDVLDASVNLNFTTRLSEHDDCTVRIATKEFTEGPLPDNTTVIIDVDVFTREPIRVKSEMDTKRWLDFAHENEKNQFFRLLQPQTIAALKEE